MARNATWNNAHQPAMHLPWLPAGRTRRLCDSFFMAEQNANVACSNCLQTFDYDFVDRSGIRTCVAPFFVDASCNHKSTCLADRVCAQLLQLQRRAVDPRVRRPRGNRAFARRISRPTYASRKPSSDRPPFATRSRTSRISARGWKRSAAPTAGSENGRGRGTGGPFSCYAAEESGGHRSDDGVQSRLPAITGAPHDSFCRRFCRAPRTTNKVGRAVDAGVRHRLWNPGGNGRQRCERRRWGRGQRLRRANLRRERPWRRERLLGFGRGRRLRGIRLHVRCEWPAEQCRRERISGFERHWHLRGIGLHDGRQRHGHRHIDGIQRRRRPLRLETPPPKTPRHRRWLARRLLRSPARP
jgi:hypothetical protein